MTREEIIEVLIIERTCVERQDTPSCDRDCIKCDLALPRDRVVKAYEQAIDILHQEHCENCEVGNPCLYCKHDFERGAE